VELVAEFQKPNFLKGDPSYPRYCICVVSTKPNAEFPNQPQCKLIISPLKYSDYKLLCHLWDADAECENAQSVCKSIVQGCIQKFQDSTCKKKFAYLGC